MLFSENASTSSKRWSGMEIRSFHTLCMTYNYTIVNTQYFGSPFSGKTQNSNQSTAQQQDCCRFHP